VLKRLPLHIVLFVLTIFTTYSVQGSALYCLCIMTILTVHELGHYLTSRRYGIATSLPFFIPFPYSLFGTLGAVIRMKGMIGNKNQLFDIGVAGPLSGFILCVPCALIGIYLSLAVRVTVPMPDTIHLSEPLLMKIASRLIVGELPPKYELLLHPVGFAGWAGFFVTALNLLPIGQLDGGHVLYAVLGEKSVWVYRVAVPVLLLLSILCFAGWIVLAILLLIFGVHHPRPLDSWTPLTRRRRLLAVAMLAIFVLSFVPAPVQGMSFIDIFHMLRK
jgi:membrane-associated protease RseP (regulator of RpoE activity)